MATIEECRLLEVQRGRKDARGPRRPSRRPQRGMVRTGVVVGVCILGSLLGAPVALGEDPPDPHAIIQAAVYAMGGSAPADSVATGAFSWVAGSLTDSGTVVLKTKGVAATRESYTSTVIDKETIFFFDTAADRDGEDIENLVNELAATSASGHFPLVTLSALLADWSAEFFYVALETVDGVSAHHVQAWTTSVLGGPLPYPLDYTQKDLWIAANSNFPIKLACVRHEAQGSEAGVSLEVRYSNYQLAGALKYPAKIDYDLNGVPWKSLEILSLDLVVGLSDSDFTFGGE